MEKMKLLINIVTYKSHCGARPRPRRLCVIWGPSPPPKFLAHVYYSYCDFVRTLHRCKALLVCSSSSSSSSLVFYAFYF